MSRRSLHFIEPSKVGQYHITLIDGYLRALMQGAVSRAGLQLIFHGSASTHENLSPDVRHGVAWRRIPVVDGDKRQLAFKTLVELFVVVRLLALKRRNDIVFVSCVLPTTLLLLELVNRILRRTNFFVVVHGEIEGAFEPSVQHFRSYGYWVLQWLNFRRRNSTLQVVVISDFARAGLLGNFPDKFDSALTHMVPHPILPASLPSRADPVDPSVCFIGYKMPFKGFAAFEAAAAAVPEVDFRVIGGGRVENLRTGRVSSLETSADFLAAIAECSAAVFPYNAGYRLSLSAAALDAIATGTHIIATPRPCFLSLQESFGSDAVTIYGSDEELRNHLATPGWLAARSAGRRERLAAVNRSPYGLDAVGKAFERVLLREPQGNEPE